jgi:hypothetical protein
MVKVKIRTGRGTSTIDVDVKDIAFSGEEYKKVQAEKKKAAGNVMVSSGRGTGRRRLADIPEPKAKPDSSGMTRITGRGTGSRKSKGSK